MLLQQVDRAITAAFDRELADHSTTRLEWQMMSVLATSREGLPWATLEDRMPRRATPDDLVAAWTGIEAGGWGLEDGERWTLTDDGRSALEDLGASVQRVRELLTADISDEEYVATVRVLERMLGNLED